MPKEKDSIKDSIKLALETYNKYASIYANYTQHKLLQYQLTNFISMLPKKAKVLDAGAGCGRDSLYMLEDGLDVTSLDISDGMIEEAKKNGVIVLKQDLLKLKSKDEFDGIWCMATFSDFPKQDASKVLKIFNLALKPNGILYIAVKEGEGEQVIEKEKYGNSPRFYAFYKKVELENLLKENGFLIQDSIVGDDDGTKWVEIFAKKN